MNTPDGSFPTRRYPYRKAFPQRGGFESVEAAPPPPEELTPGVLHQLVMGIDIAPPTPMKAAALAAPAGSLCAAVAQTRHLSRHAEGLAAR